MNTSGANMLDQFLLMLHCHARGPYCKQPRRHCIYTSNPTRTFVFVQTMEIEVNPLRTAIIEYSPIQLTILAPAK
jgi:hypothetical protein